MTALVRKIINDIYAAYDAMERNGLDISKEPITLSHDTIFELINCIENMDEELSEEA